jgi:hypothetical protein
MTDRYLAYRKHVEQLGIDEIMEYSVSSAKLILRIFDAYLVKNPESEISFFKDKFTLTVMDMELFGKGDLTKQSEIHKGFGELLGCVEPFYKNPFIDFGVSVIFDLMRLVLPTVDYLKTTGEKKLYDGAAYFYFRVNENYMSYVTRFGWLCQKWNKLKKNL